VDLKKRGGGLAEIFQPFMGRGAYDATPPTDRDGYDGNAPACAHGSNGTTHANLKAKERRRPLGVF
jgi:hypothetical protein